MFPQFFFGRFLGVATAIFAYMAAKRASFETGESQLSFALFVDF
jgi:hypothetical protein